MENAVNQEHPNEAKSEAPQVKKKSRLFRKFMITSMILFVEACLCFASGAYLAEKLKTGEIDFSSSDIKRLAKSLKLG